MGRSVFCEVCYAGESVDGGLGAIFRRVCSVEIMETGMGMMGVGPARGRGFRAGRRDDPGGSDV